MFHLVLLKHLIKLENVASCVAVSDVLFLGIENIRQCFPIIYLDRRTFVFSSLCDLWHPQLDANTFRFASDFLNNPHFQLSDFKATIFMQ